MPFQLSPRDQALHDQLLKQGLLSETDLRFVLEKAEKTQIAAQQPPAGLEIVIEADQLYLRDLQKQTELAQFALRSEPSRGPAKTWGQTQVLVNELDGKEKSLHALESFPQGLFLSASGQVFSCPMGASEPELALSQWCYSSQIASPTREAYDLYLSPDLQFLCVIHRWAGQISLISLSTYQLLGLIQIRPAGFDASINISIDSLAQTAYITDNVSHSLSLLDLATLQVSPFELPMGVLGNLVLAPDARYLYLTLLKPRFALIYLELATLNEVKQLDLKGESLFLNSPLPVDLMHLTPAKDLLLFSTYLDTPRPRTPVIHVIQSDKVRTVRRYTIKEGGLPLLLATATENPAYCQPFNLYRTLRDTGLVTESELRQLALSSAPSAVSDTQQSSRHQPSVVPDFKTMPRPESRFQKPVAPDLRPLLKRAEPDAAASDLPETAAQMPESVEAVQMESATQSVKPTVSVPPPPPDLRSQSSVIASRPDPTKQMVPALKFAPEAESVIYELLSEKVETHLESKGRLALAAQPLEKRALRELAFAIKDDLEIQLQANQCFEQVDGDLILELDRQTLLNALASLRPAPNPLYLPLGICPICGSNKPLSNCRQCGFELSARQALKPKVKGKKALPLASTGNAELEKTYVALLKQVSFLKDAPLGILERIASLLQGQILVADELLINEGQVGDSLYFILTGQLEVSKSEENQAIAVLEEGDVVGEMALILSEPRSANVRALTDAKVLRLSRRDFLRIVIDHPEFSKRLRELAFERARLVKTYTNGKTQQLMGQIKARMAMQKLKALPIFAQAPSDFFEALSHKVETVAFLPKTEVFLQGESADRLYFIAQGRVDVFLGNQVIASLSEGELFGEMAWLLQQPRNATVQTQSYCKFIELSYTDFENVAKTFPTAYQRVSDLVEQRQAKLDEELKAQLSVPETQSAMALPRLAIHSQREHPQQPIYYLSPLEQQVFGISDETVDWGFGQEQEERFFQPLRAEYNSYFSESLLIADTGNDRILELSLQQQKITASWGDHHLPLSQPTSACFSPQGWMLIADAGHQRLIQVNLQHEVVWEHQQSVLSPQHVSFTPQGNVLYADSGLHQVIEINPQGEVLWSYGTALISGSDDNELYGPAYARRFDDGRTLIADSQNHRLLWIGADGKLAAIWAGDAETTFIDPVHCELTESGGLIVFSGSDESITYLSATGQPLWQASLTPA